MAKAHTASDMPMHAASFPKVPQAWTEHEMDGCAFPDRRLGKRLRFVLDDLSSRIGGSIPWACQDWAATKAAYRFFSNPRVNEEKILAGHFRATQDRVHRMRETILILHDTTELSYQREKCQSVGLLRKCVTGKTPEGRPRLHTVCGILMHSSLATTTAGLPLGLTAVKFWTRAKFKGTQALRGKICPTRVPVETKESIRWLENLHQSTALLGDPKRCVHIGDRESDIYELFCAAEEEGTYFLVRTCVDRLAEDGTVTIAREMNQAEVRAVHRIEVRNPRGECSQAVLEIRCRTMAVCPPIGKHKRYPKLNLTVLHAEERNPPAGRDRIVWKLLTNLPVRSRQEMIEKLQWYAQRWKIETFHKVLKSGCRAEEARLRTANRLVNLLAVLCILSWRVFWTTMLQRTAPKAAPGIAFTPLELQIMDVLVKDRPRQTAKKLSGYMTKLAQLGGYLARVHDPPPGNMVIWRGLCRLTDIELGATLITQVVGN
jgi:hypothetical protein